MKHKILFACSLGLSLVTLLPSCDNNGTSLIDKLKNIDGISNIIDIQTESSKDLFKNCYSFTMKQYIDWNNPNLGSFNQRASIYYVSDDSPIEFYVNGYLIDNVKPEQFVNKNEISSHYHTNVIQIEYRFFDKSVPEGFDLKGIKYYQYLNSYQASKDFYHIVSSLKTILKGPSIFTGGSKGGYSTEAMAYYYPDEINAYISYVAPFCNGDYDQRFSNYVYTTIGNKGYGEELALKYRQIVSTFQKTALSEKFRYKIMEILKPSFANEDEEVSEDEYFEFAIYNFAVGTWQYYNDFDKIEAINNMNETTQEEIDAKALAMANKVKLIIKIIAGDELFLPYYVQAKTEMGLDGCSLEYLRNQGMNIKTASSKDALLPEYLYLTKTQRENLKYSPNFRNSMIDFFNTTTKEIIKIVGVNDPWYAVRASEYNNTNIHYYEANGNHITSKINNLSNSSEVWGIIDRLLGIKN